jgi:hypothetical protein
MPRVVIQPAFGGAAARQHWRDTLDSEVKFAAAPYSAVLSVAQLAALAHMHPAGQARFFGATEIHDRTIRQLSAGDVILFTGGKRIRAVGEMGVILQDAAAFGDLMWSPDPRNGSYCNVYSLRGFEPVEIPYEEVWEIGGFTPGDNFPGLRLLSAAQGDALLAGLRIATITAAEEETAAERALAAALERRAGKVVGAEAVNTARTSYDRPAGTTLVNRAESLLIQAYRQSIASDQGTTLRVPTGIADHYAETPEGSEIIEAKSISDHLHVRQAIIQLLDYSRFSPRPVIRLAALFPDRPGPEGIQLLHDCDIDCIYLGTDGEFVRLPAPPRPRKVWQDIAR